MKTTMYLCYNQNEFRVNSLEAKPTKDFVYDTFQYTIYQNNLIEESDSNPLLCPYSPFLISPFHYFYVLVKPFTLLFTRAPPLSFSWKTFKRLRW